jgi:serine/threonine-protein kinase
MSAAPEPESTAKEAPTHYGQYTVVRELGRGGMALVFEGRHPQLGSRVALKVMQPALAAQPMAAARFLREAKAASQIRHQNVVEVFDIGTQDGVPFIVMEFLEGANLAALLAEKGALPVAGMVDVFLPVISAVATAHRAGIIHRDLKPSNLMITRRAPRGAQAMVLDFGISKIMSEELEGTLTRSESLLGTVQYMAPELTKGAKFASPASDQYAIGAMLYECATGQRPFTGESYYDLMHAIVTAPIKPPSELCESLPPEFDEMVLRAMSRDPASRFPSVQALGSALLSFGDKSAWALWEGEFLGAPGNEREPWSVGPSTLNDGMAAPMPVRRSPKKRPARWTAWALWAAVVYAAVITVLLGRRGPSVPSPTPSANAVTASLTSTTSLAVPTGEPIHDRPATPPVPETSAAPPSSALAIAPVDPRSRTRKPAKERMPPPLAPAGGPAAVASATPRAASTVGTNGAPIVE